MAARTTGVVATADGSCPVVLATPDSGGPWPAVLFYMDAGGVRPSLVDMAERLADIGYVVALPEFYYRHGAYAPFDTATAFGDPDERSRLFGMLTGLTKEMVASDTRALLEFLAGRLEVAGPRVGTTGYCSGGGLSLTAAARFPERVAAAASFHGGNLATDDGSFPPDQAALLEQALTEAGVEHTIETYPAAHGFAVPDMPTFDADAAERHWRALHDLFEATLSW